jgi:hypothetical protein
VITISKIVNDKYYTSPELAEYIVNKTKKIIGEEKITEYIEPSAGGGAFLDYLDKSFLAYDIEPEDNRILKQDFLSLDLDYKKGRCIIGNPPYGEFNLLSEKFFKKSIKICDYISFIQPISQYKNNIKLYEFDLIYSEDLGKQIYTDREIHCCLNIYRRPINGEVNKKQNYKLKDVSITRLDRGSKTIINEYDINICSYGASIGKIPKFIGQYSQELYIKICNEKYRNQIINLIINTNWKQIIDMTATPKLQIWRVYKYIKEQIPEIQ